MILLIRIFTAEKCAHERDGYSNKRLILQPNLHKIVNERKNEKNTFKRSPNVISLPSTFITTTTMTFHAITALDERTW